MPVQQPVGRQSFREPIPEIEIAADYLDAAVSAHIAGNRTRASELFSLADDPKIRAWLDSIWGAKSPYVRLHILQDTPAILPHHLRTQPRQATASHIRESHRRDGYHCRFCKIPVIRAKIRKFLNKAYPESVPWGTKNIQCHAAFQCMWAQYDHIFPHARGGATTLENLCLTCAACNYGRMDYTLDQVGLLHPDNHPPRISAWDGLERVLTQRVS